MSDSRRLGRRIAGLPRRWRVAGAVVAAAAIGLVVWALVAGGGSNHSAAPVLFGLPVAATEAGLRTIVAGYGHPLYWVGAAPGSTYEVTQTRDGRVYVRYLPAGAAVGVRHAYLTVATYPLKGAFAATVGASARVKSKLLRFKSGAVAYVSRSPTSVYVAFPGFDFQIEVYDPSPGRALGFVQNGALQPIR